RAQDGSPFHHRAFVHAAVAANEDFIFDDDGKRADRFQHATNLRARGAVARAPDLGTATDQRVRIDHGLLAHVSANVNEQRWHPHYAAANVAAVANARTAGHDAHTVLR